MQAEKELHAARLKLVDLEMANKKQELAIAESAGHICRLQNEAAAASDLHLQQHTKGELLSAKLPCLHTRE